MTRFTKIMVGLAMFIAWAIIVALLIAGLNSVQNNELSGTTITKSTVGNTINNIQGLTLTPKEAAKHNTEEDCWMIIEGKVYDLTGYVGLHPAGVQYIIMSCGKDGSAMYQSRDGPGKDHSAYARSLLPQYYLGDLNQQVTAESMQKVQQQALTASQTTQGRGDDDDDFEDDD